MNTPMQTHLTPSRLGGSPSRRTWRATAATRVFGLALAIGQVLDADAVARSLPALFALVLLATVASAIEAGRMVRSTWVPVVEALLAATLLAGLLPGGALFVYLAVPAVVAGIGQGWVTAVNATLTGSLGFYAASMTTRDLLVVPEDVGAAGLWLVVGLGAGLLAGWQTRSLRQVETRQAPYAAAHRLVAELSALTQSSEVGLDPVTVARHLGLRLAEEAGAIRWSVYVAGTGGELEALAAHQPLPSFPILASQLRNRRGSSSHHGTTAAPLRVGDHRFGVVVLDRESGWSRQDHGQLQQAVDELAVRLETALLFDQVRDAATTEERQRLARDIHDGVAQEMVALGYLVDEIEATTAEPDTLRMAADLRQEIGRAVGELRFSIFDLRHESDQHVSSALAEYVREVSAGTELRVHFVFDDQGTPLPPRVESELLRVAQEAIGNVRKHARADNLWVTFTSDGSTIHLEVADDGVGSAHPRQRHYGLHTMRERAERLDAELTVLDRPGGGTVVNLTSRMAPPTPIPATTQHRAEVTA